MNLLFIGINFKIINKTAISWYGSNRMVADMVLPFLLSYSNRTIGKNAWFTLLTLCVLRGQGRRLLRTGRSTSSWLPCPVYIAAIQAGLCNWGYPYA